MKQTEQITKAWREEFDTALPELLEKAEVELRDKFVAIDLPALLEVTEGKLMEDFEETALPGLLEEAEAKLREDFEEELQENLDKIDVVEEEAMEEAR